MAITHTTLINNQDMLNASDHTQAFNMAKAVYNAILEAYSWETGSEVTVGESITSTYATYYFTTNSYIKISTNANYPEIKIDIVTPNGSKRVADCVNSYWTFSIGKTSKGICICAYSGPINSRSSPFFYNLYIGEITKLDGSITKGCIYAADDGTLTIATDDGISTEIAQTSSINADRTAILAPVVDTTYGNVFKDIYFMRSSPLNCNIMAVEGQGNFLCGKTLCLKDQEVGA